MSWNMIGELHVIVSEPVIRIAADVLLLFVGFEFPHLK